MRRNSVFPLILLAFIGYLIHLIYNFFQAAAERANSFITSLVLHRQHFFLAITGASLICIVIILIKRVRFKKAKIQKPAETTEAKRLTAVKTLAEAESQRLTKIAETAGVGKIWQAYLLSQEKTEEPCVALPVHQESFDSPSIQNLHSPALQQVTSDHPLSAGFIEKTNNVDFLLLHTEDSNTAILSPTDLAHEFQIATTENVLEPPIAKDIGTCKKESSFLHIVHTEVGQITPKNQVDNLDVDYTSTQEHRYASQCKPNKNIIAVGFYVGVDNQALKKMYSNDPRYSEQPTFIFDNGKIDIENLPVHDVRYDYCTDLDAVLELEDSPNPFYRYWKSIMVNGRFYNEIFTLVRGVRYTNDDGSSRFENVKKLFDRAVSLNGRDCKIKLLHRPDNPHDSNAIEVFAENIGLIGYLKSDLAYDIVHYYPEHLWTITAEPVEIAGDRVLIKVIRHSVVLDKLPEKYRDYSKPQYKRKGEIDRETKISNDYHALVGWENLPGHIKGLSSYMTRNDEVAVPYMNESIELSAKIFISPQIIHADNVSIIFSKKKEYNKLVEHISRFIDAQEKFIQRLDDSDLEDDLKKFIREKVDKDLNTSQWERVLKRYEKAISHQKKTIKSRN